MNILEAAKKVPEYGGGKGWVKYKKTYFFLVDEKSYPPIKAIEWIAEQEGLSDKDQTKLYNASKSWVRPANS